MKRAVICSRTPWKYINTLPDYSLMIVNPDNTPTRLEYLLSHSDWSLMVTDSGIQERNGPDVGNYRLFHYTSGTTGDSKFYSFTQVQLDIMIEEVRKWYDLTPNDRYYSVMPLWHGHGQLIYFAAQGAGCEIQFGSVRDQKTIEKFNPTFLSVIPDIGKLFSTFNMPDLRFMGLGSAPITDVDYLKIKERIGVPVINRFGCTEYLGLSIANPLYGEQRLGTIGLPVGVDIRVDENKHLWLSGPRLYKEGWYDTGDLVEQDDDGYITILGRAVDQINIRGYKIDPLSIENQLLNHFPGITECAVFGLDRLNCVYVGNETEKEVTTFLSNISSYCKPKMVRSLAEIPKNNIGKVSRTGLTKLYSQ